MYENYFEFSSNYSLIQDQCSMCNHICFYLSRKRGSGLCSPMLTTSKLTCLRGALVDTENFMSKLIISYRKLYPFIPLFPFLRIFRIKRICFFEESVSLIKEHAPTLSLNVGDCFNHLKLCAVHVRLEFLLSYLLFLSTEFYQGQLFYSYALWQLNRSNYLIEVLTQSLGDSICVYIVRHRKDKARVSQADYIAKLPTTELKLKVINFKEILFMQENFHYSINEFCKLNNFSRSYFRKLVNANKAPKLYKIDPSKPKSRVFIPRESANEWYEQNIMDLQEYIPNEKNS